VSVLIGAAFLWVPGFGPLLVVGRLAALLLAGVEGALANWGIAEEHILDYEKRLREGKHLVIAYGTAEEVARAHDILQGTTAGALRAHAGASA
jgi:hypothetical protein